MSKRLCFPSFNLLLEKSEAVFFMASSFDFISSNFSGPLPLAAPKRSSNSDKRCFIFAWDSTGSPAGELAEGLIEEPVGPNFFISERSFSLKSESLAKASSRTIFPFCNSAPRSLTESSEVLVCSKFGRFCFNCQRVRFSRLEPTSSMTAESRC